MAMLRIVVSNTTAITPVSRITAGLMNAGSR
jgi:hypothetical protein